MVDFYRDVFQKTEWPPDVVLSMPPSFWYALAGAGDEKLEFATYEEMKKYIDEVLTPSQTPEAEMETARRELRFELDWYTHDGL